MRVIVEYQGQARTLAGVRREELTLPACATLLQLLHTCTVKYPALTALLLVDGQPARSLLVAVGELQVDASSPAPLSEGDEVLLIPPIAGGSLTEADRVRYEWQLWMDGIGEVGQAKLKSASVLVSRVGGLGGLTAYQLAAAGVGRIVLAHAGNLKRSDLHRQLLMSDAAVGTSRVACAAARLRALNPTIEVVELAENLTADNAMSVIAGVDVVVSAAPWFEERLAMNHAAVTLGKPMVDAAMYAWTGQLTTILPGRTACLACRVPELPTAWDRRFPVLGAVSGTIGCLAAVEAMKLLLGSDDVLADRLLTLDLQAMQFRTIQLVRRDDCAVCGGGVGKDACNRRGGG